MVTSMGFARQIQLLLWKNWTLRKRQKVTGAVCGLKVRCGANKQWRGWAGVGVGKVSCRWAHCHLEPKQCLGGCFLNLSDNCPSQEDLFLCPEMDTFHLQPSMATVSSSFALPAYESIAWPSLPPRPGFETCQSSPQALEHP